MIDMWTGCSLEYVTVVKSIMAEFHSAVSGPKGIMYAGSLPPVNTR